MNAQNNANFSFSSPFPTMASFGHPPPAQPEDPNSPALFKENVKTVQSQINFVRTLAHQALHSIKGAYQPGSSPAQIAQNLATLRQNLQVLNETLLNSGVGSLPLLPPETAGPPTEEQLAEQANRAISALFTLHTRMQETASVTANIMAAPEQALRR
ncbi:hypothetical protein BC834DRAFT_850713 [Gloeopeniophorella convolvens]|nr:hypothetical protein BC834DRAFT_850713 [Gloeopeniophorella convolvens]